MVQLELVAREVVWRQSSMTLNDSSEWVDVEADEVLFAEVLPRASSCCVLSGGLRRKGHQDLDPCGLWSG
eukprot:5802574-Amphidinium_carterae.2